MPTAEPSDLMIFPLDRAEGKVYKRSISKNIAPTLTTTNKYLFVVSMADLEKPAAQRKFFRFLHPSDSFLVHYKHVFFLCVCVFFWGASGRFVALFQKYVQYSLLSILYIIYIPSTKETKNK